MKKSVLVLCCFFTVLFSGCSYSGLNIDNLISPPKLSEQQNDIYTALEASVGNNIKLKYPKKGDFTSAFLINNIDSEPTQEAIVFYENTANATATMPLRINVLDQNDGVWESKYEIGVASNEVEKVSFVTLNNQMYIVIGFNVSSKDEKLLGIYTYEDYILEERHMSSCIDYEIMDLNNDNLSELITITTKKNEFGIKTTTANVQRISAQGAMMLSQTQMDPNVTEYVNIYKSKIENDIPALYIDGLKGTNSLYTEILIYEKDSVKNLIYDPDKSKDLMDKTARNYGAATFDFDSDGIMEIPCVVPAKSFENKLMYDQLYFTQWYEYRSGSLQLESTTYVSYSLGYIFTLPNEWVENVTVDYVSIENELIFYDYSKIDTIDAKLISIKAIKRADYESGAKNRGYTLLLDNGQILYVCKTYDTDSEIALSLNDVKKHFTLL